MTGRKTATACCFGSRSRGIRALTSVSGARPAHPITIPAGGVAAPSFDSALGAVHENPGTIGVGADLQPTRLMGGKRLGERIGNQREPRGPANLYGFMGEPQPILVLHKPAKHR